MAGGVKQRAVKSASPEATSERNTRRLAEPARIARDSVGRSRTTTLLCRWETFAFRTKLKSMFSNEKALAETLVWQTSSRRKEGSDGILPAPQAHGSKLRDSRLCSRISPDFAAYMASAITTATQMRPSLTGSAIQWQAVLICSIQPRTRRLTTEDLFCLHTLNCRPHRRASSRGAHSTQDLHTWYHGKKRTML